jgi:predicted RNA-binding Zn ribbon-like protein
VNELRFVEELVNTRSLEFGTDDIATPESLAGWLHERGLLPEGSTVDEACVRKAHVAREGLRALIARNNTARDTDADPDGPADAMAVEALAALAGELPLVLDVTVDPPRLAPGTGRPVDDALARILGAVAAAVADGTWARMKVCRQPDCRWAYFDASRNRSRSWCSMETCGNRAKARSFRQRQR